MARDKQLRGVALDRVVEKRRLGQALNAKEFAILVGISYSAAREWFRLPGFPLFRGYVFWQDFTEWRRAQAHLNMRGVELAPSGVASPAQQTRVSVKDLPPRAARILLEGS